MSRKGALVASGMALILTACGGDGGSESGSVDPASEDSYSTVQDLTGSSVFSLSFGGLSIVNEFSYGSLVKDGGTTYRVTSSRYTNSAVSVSVTHSPILCADWTQIAEAASPGDSGFASIFEGAYICSYFSTDAERWYEIYISDAGNITGSYVFDVTSANGLELLATRPTAQIFGTHNPSKSKARGVDTQAIEIVDAIEASALPALARSKLASPHHERLRLAAELFRAETRRD